MGIVCDLALIFSIGIMVGTFSSIFIASPIFYWWHKGDRRHVEAHELLPVKHWQMTHNAE
jgi:SecD/SecF fusion protein